MKTLSKILGFLNSPDKDNIKLGLSLLASQSNEFNSKEKKFADFLLKWYSPPVKLLQGNLLIHGYCPEKKSISLGNLMVDDIYLPIEIVKMEETDVPILLELLPELFLEHLSIYNTNVKELKVFPKGLKRLSLYNTQTEIIENLPDTVSRIHCEKNKLTKLPINNRLFRLEVQDNLIEKIPEEFSKKLEWFKVSGNPISEFPNWCEKILCFIK